MNYLEDGDYSTEIHDEQKGDYNLYSTTPNVNCTIYICEKITENNGDFQENGGKEDEGQEQNRSGKIVSSGSLPKEVEEKNFGLSQEFQQNDDDENVIDTLAQVEVQQKNEKTDNIHTPLSTNNENPNQQIQDENSVNHQEENYDNDLENYLTQDDNFEAANNLQHNDIHNNVENDQLDSIHDNQNEQN